MINGSLDQFLDTGWFTEATLFYNGFIYWCEAQSDPITNYTTFFVDKCAVENEDNTYYHSLLEPDGTLIWNRVFEISDTDMDRIKQNFLESHIFDNKTFWEVEKEIAWLDESCPITKGQSQESAGTTDLD